MRRAAMVLVGLVLAGMGSFTPPAAAAETGFWVNIVEAENLGCSDDGGPFDGGPDLRVVVTIDGQAFQSGVGGSAKPLYAQVFPVANPTRSVPVEIKVQEADPGGGFLGFGTKWIDCDSPYYFSWAGEDRTVTTVGTSDKSATTTVVFGRGAPSAPVFAAKDIQPTAAAFVWDAGPVGSDHRFIGNLPGEDGTYGPEGATKTVDGLCQNQEYRVHLVRDLGDWSVGTHLSFRTVNVAPPTPRLAYAVLADGNLTAKVNLHVVDVVRGEMHVAANPDFVPNPDTLVAVRQDTRFNFRLDSYAMAFRASGLNASAAYVKVVLTDNGNLSSTSEALAIGAPGAGSDDGARYDCNGVLVKPAPTLKPRPARTDPFAAAAEEARQEEAASKGSSGLDGLVDAVGLGPFLLGAAMAAVVVGAVIGLALRRR